MNGTHQLLFINADLLGEGRNNMKNHSSYVTCYWVYFKANTQKYK
jgi:hypothetical protein